ncbi:MAG: hypothetical protein K1X88_18190 [Nannocystaceae bacterium]|nr:hypothetical protein [Nannocystaceae bacterium]
MRSWLEIPRSAASKLVPMQVHTLAAPERRMLLEMLASERAGEDALHVGSYLGRSGIAERLCAIDMSEWVDDDHVVFTWVGRCVAEILASHLVQAHAADAA